MISVDTDGWMATLLMYAVCPEIHGTHIIVQQKGIYSGVSENSSCTTMDVLPCTKD